VVEAARARAESFLDPGSRLELTTSNSDALDAGVSFGQHLNVCVQQELWEELFVDPRRPAVLGFVASSLAAAIPFFGAGQILALTGERALFSLSGRAHHLRRVMGSSTTQAFERSLLHDRREPHGSGHDRLHLIGFDAAPLASVLTACFLQCVLAAAEIHQGGHGLAAPLDALRAFSWDPALAETGRPRRTARLNDGRDLNLAQYLREVAEALLALCESGEIAAAHVPGAREHLPLIIELTHHLEQGCLDACARHLDWAAKLVYLARLEDELGLGLEDVELRLADHDFGSTRPEGVLSRLVSEGLVDPLVEPAAIEAALEDGPEDARGWARGRLIRAFPELIARVDWHALELQRTPNAWGPRLRIELPHLWSLRRSVLEPLLRDVHDIAELERAVARQVEAPTRSRDPLDDLGPELDLPPQDLVRGRWG
jgi:proteasome accessory factor A